MLVFCGCNRSACQGLCFCNIPQFTKPSLEDGNDTFISVAFVVDPTCGSYFGLMTRLTVPSDDRINISSGPRVRTLNLYPFHFVLSKFITN
jgi:hypothetical protein